MELHGSLHQLLEDGAGLEDSEVVLAVRRSLAGAQASLRSIEVRIDIAVADIARSHTAREDVKRRIAELSDWLDHLPFGGAVVGTATTPYARPDGEMSRHAASGPADNS